MSSRRVATLVAVACGGALGTVARYEVTLTWPAAAGDIAWGTFAVNVVGAFVLGAVVAFDATTRSHPLLRPFAAAGVCGGLTTFSTWMLASVLFVRDGHAGAAALDLTLGLVCGVPAVAAGFAGTRRLLHTRGFVPFDPGDLD